MKRTALSLLALALSLFAGAQTIVRIHDTATDQPLIPKEIYGQFSEHLGRCIYDGIWVGPDSSIPNVAGYRKDVLEALRALKVPVLRWPGGCFADEYHWRDGIGPRPARPKMINSNWGGTVEDNSFGTHEFLEFCELLGAEPYISGNVGSGSVEEMAKWVEYMTARAGTLAEERKANGREEPWRIKYFGIGNESWGCGGSMRPEYYADVYRRYATYCRNFDGNNLYKVASGASDYDYTWTKVLMQNARDNMHALSLHYYSGEGGYAAGFTTDQYYDLLGKAVEVDEVLTKHEAIMDAYDPDRKVDLLLDEWGTWYRVEPGTNPGHLFQQNTQRDALIAALSFHIFHEHVRRLKMANIAQIVNVLQSMVLTRGEEMVLTPTYHVFRMFNVHQDATFVPTEVFAGEIVSPSGRPVPALSASTSRDASGRLHVSLVNPSADSLQTVELQWDGPVPQRISGEILAAPSIRSFNDFGKAPEVAPAPFTAFRKNGGKVTLTLPAASVVVLELE